jgi:type IV pilus assembly protein PilW
MISRTVFSKGNSQGFTLVELMVTLAMSGIIVAVVYAAYIIQQKTYRNQGQVVEMQQNIRAALELMSSEIRMAGYDPTGGKTPSIVLATPTSLQFTLDLNEDGDVGDPNENVTYSLGGTDGNGDGVVDNLDTNNDGQVDITNTLLRNTGGGGQSIAENIHAMKLCYILEGNTLDAPCKLPAAALSSGDRKKILAVKIAILAVSGQRDPKYTDTVTTQRFTGLENPNGTPFNFAAFNDNFRRRLLVSTVNFRNRGL